MEPLIPRASFVAHSTIYIFDGPDGRFLAAISASYDRDSLPNSDYRGSAGRCWKEISHAPTAAVAVVERGAYHTADDAGGRVRLASQAASSNEAVPTDEVASTGKVGARIVTVGDAAAAADNITVCQATFTVIANISEADAYYDRGSMLWSKYF